MHFSIIGLQFVLYDRLELENGLRQMVVSQLRPGFDLLDTHGVKFEKAENVFDRMIPMRVLSVRGEILILTHIFVIDTDVSVGI